MATWIELLAGGPPKKGICILTNKETDTIFSVAFVQMPGLDGPQTLARLQQIDPRVRCCFMSASTGPYSAQELLARGARCLVPKPFPSLAELGRLLGQIIRSAPAMTP